VTTNFFDANGNLVATVTPIGAGTGCNPLTSSTCIGASYSVYDADNRLLSTSYTDGTPSVTYTYNADGSKATQTDSTGTSTFSYDSAGRLIGTTNGAGATTTWGYNTLGQLICQSYDNVAGNTCRGSGAGTSSPPAGLLTFTYDALGRASSLITWSGVTLTTAYDCAGSKAWVSTGTASVLSCDESHLGTPAIPTSGSAITTTYSSNSLGQFTNQATTTNGGATNLLSFAFSYDDLSRLISSTPTVNSLTKTTDSYDYDQTSRVTSGPITGTTGNPNYSYSQSGAITQATTHFASAAYWPNGQLCWTNPTAVTSPSCASTPSTATTFTYDLNGNRTATSSATNSTSLTWQATSGRLTCINTAGTTCSTTSPTSTTTLYSYDGDGHRMTSANNGTTNAFIWDTGASQLLADSTHDYVYLQGSVTPDLQINLTTGTVDLLIQDQNSNTRGVVQVTGANSSLNNSLVNYTDYDAYGNAITQSGGTINPGGMANGGVTTDISTSFAFGAGYWDSSNLTYLVHRYLDNETGQFISVDPLVDQTREAYVYAGDGPVMGIDAMGLLGGAPTFREYAGLETVTWKPVSVKTGETMSLHRIYSLLVAMLLLAEANQMKSELQKTRKVKIPILFGQRRISPFFDYKDGDPKIYITAKYSGTPIKVFPGSYQGKLCAIAINNRTLANASLTGIKTPVVEWDKPTDEEVQRLLDEPTNFSKGTLPSRTIPVTSKRVNGSLLTNYGKSGYVTSKSYTEITS
jgi:RHS repeat-associated protein